MKVKFSIIHFRFVWMFILFGLQSIALGQEGALYQFNCFNNGKIRQAQKLEQEQLYQRLGVSSYTYYLGKHKHYTCYLDSLGRLVLLYDFSYDNGSDTLSVYKILYTANPSVYVASGRSMIDGLNFDSINDTYITNHFGLDSIVVSLNHLKKSQDSTVYFYNEYADLTRKINYNKKNDTIRIDSSVFRITYENGLIISTYYNSNQNPSVRVSYRNGLVYEYESHYSRTLHYYDDSKRLIKRVTTEIDSWRKERSKLKYADNGLLQKDGNTHYKYKFRK